jgi:hypothetical protein
MEKNDIIADLIEILKEYANEDNWYTPAGDYYSYRTLNKNVWMGDYPNGYDLAKEFLQKINELSLKNNKEQLKLDM